MIECLNTVINSRDEKQEVPMVLPIDTDTFRGIVAHGKFHIANGRMEGLDQKIKNMCRHAYGIADDEYLFLKIMDLSSTSYVRSPKSHKVLH